MAEKYLPPLETRSLEPTKPRRGSSFRKRLKRTESNAPEMAMHVLLPKIFGGEIAAYEPESNSEEEGVSSPDSAVEVTTPPEGIQDVPPITITFSHERPGDASYPIRETSKPLVRERNVDTPVRLKRNPSRYPQNRNEFEAIAPAPRPQSSNPPHRPGIERGTPYDPDDDHILSSRNPTPRASWYERSLAVSVSQLSVEMTQLHLAIETNRIHDRPDQNSENRLDPVAGASGRNRSFEFQAEGAEERVLDFKPRLRASASW